MPDTDMEGLYSRLARGVASGAHEDAYRAYKGLYQLGDAALPFIQEKLLRADFKSIQYVEQTKIIAALANLVHDIDETVSKELHRAIKKRDCHRSIEKILDIIDGFSTANFERYIIEDVEVFESKRITPRHDVRSHLDDWFENLPKKDLAGIERIYVVNQKEEREYLGNYMPFLAVITLVWDNPLFHIEFVSRLAIPMLENTFYHEVGHHYYRHTFGQDPEQEKEADRYAVKMLAKSRPVMMRSFWIIAKILQVLGLYRWICGPRR